jgi:hypothetical protein
MLRSGEVNLPMRLAYVSYEDFLTNKFIASRARAFYLKSLIFFVLKADPSPAV